MSQPPYPPPPGPYPDPGQPGEEGGPNRPSGTGGPEGPVGPQKESRTGIIISLVALGVLLIAAAVVALVLLLGGDDEAEPASTPTAGETDGDAAGETEDAEPAAEGDVVGDGYHFALPDGWQDISDGAEVSSQQTLDTGAANGPSIQEASANVLVEKVPTGEAATSELLDQLRTTYESQFEAEVEQLDDREIGGEAMPALTMTRPSTTNESLDVMQVSYVTTRDGDGYVITTSRVVEAEDAEPEIEEILDSWVWE